MNIHKIIYLAGMKYRNPSLLPYLNFLKNSDLWSFERLKEYQLMKFKHLVETAYLYSPYYRNVFAELGISANDIVSLDDIKKFPIIDKSVLLQHNSEIHTTCNFKKRVFSETSGTSGQVLSFFRNEEWDSATRAAQYRGYSWYGVNPWDRNGYFWGYNIDKSQRKKTEFLDGLVNRFRIFSYNEDEIKKFAERLKTAVYVEGYSSMIYEVAKIVNKMNGGGDFNLKMVKGTSEKIYESYQGEVEKAFGHKMISEYGSCETGIIAFECPAGHMHIAMENVLVEEIDGAAVVTNLVSDSFPIIRYRLGDAIKLAPEGFKCSCGRQHPVILDVVGRIGKNIIGKKCKYPSLTFYYVFKNLTLNSGITLNYQALQEKRGEITLKIEQDDRRFQNDLLKELKKYFAEDVDFLILWGQRLHTMDGKLKDFITTLE